jgi:hypothetical protein
VPAGQPTRIQAPALTGQSAGPAVRGKVKSNACPFLASFWEYKAENGKARRGGQAFSMCGNLFGLIAAHSTERLQGSITFSMGPGMLPQKLQEPHRLLRYQKPDARRKVTNSATIFFP